MNILARSTSQKLHFDWYQNKTGRRMKFNAIKVNWKACKIYLNEDFFVANYNILFDFGVTFGDLTVKTDVYSSHSKTFYRSIKQPFLCDSILSRIKKVRKVQVAEVYMSKPLRRLFDCRHGFIKMSTPSILLQQLKMQWSKSVLNWDIRPLSLAAFSRAAARRTELSISYSGVRSFLLSGPLKFQFLYKEIVHSTYSIICITLLASFSSVSATFSLYRLITKLHKICGTFFV